MKLFRLILEPWRFYKILITDLHRSHEDTDPLRTGSVRIKVKNESRSALIENSDPDRGKSRVQIRGSATPGTIL
jgi:hypothetical protein